MNEQAVTAVCFIFAILCAVLFWGASRYGDQGCMILGSFFSIIVTLLCGFIVVCRYL